MRDCEGWHRLHRLTIEAIDEATTYALIAAETMTGINGNTVYELPHEQLKDILGSRGVLK